MHLVPIFACFFVSIKLILTPVNTLISVSDHLFAMFISSIKTTFELLDWIPIEKLNWSFLSQNPSAIDWLEANQDKIDWESLSKNPNAVKLLAANQDKIDWCWLSKNPAALGLLRENPDKIHWAWLSQNTSASAILKAHLEKVDWAWMSQNSSMMDILESNLDKINWNWLSINPSAIHLLEANLDKINWYWLSSNPAAMHLLEANLDKINWSILSRNPAAIEMLKCNQDKIDWDRLSANPAIFVQTTKKKHWSYSQIETRVKSLQLDTDDDTQEMLQALIAQINSPIVYWMITLVQWVSLTWSFGKRHLWDNIIESKYGSMIVEFMKRLTCVLFATLIVVLMSCEILLLHVPLKTIMKSWYKIGCCLLIFMIDILMFAFWGLYWVFLVALALFIRIFIGLI